LQGRSRDPTWGPDLRTQWGKERVGQIEKSSTNGTPLQLAWRIQGRGSLAGCRLWGRTESDTTHAT
ncbi:hypothetical protein DBN73_16950, partial [Enterococcus faecalis]|nr:hypothetical protein [Enterococcus faecalis]